MNRRALLVLSLGLNVLLIGAVVWIARFRAPVAVRPAVVEPITNRVVRIRLATNEAAPAVIEIAAPFNWAQVESTDYRVYLANLREIGCPEATIRDIIEADANELFSGRVKELVDSVTGRFWDLMANQKKTEELLKDKLHALESLNDQRGQMTKELFDDDPLAAKAHQSEQRTDQLTILKRQFDFLPEDKVSQIQDAYDRFQIAQAEAYKTNTSPADQQEQYKRLSAQENSEIQALLTPEEYKEYQLRTKADLIDVRNGLSDLDVTPEEVHAIAGAKMDGGDEAIRQLLGPERFADYQRSIDQAYQQTLRITERFDFPAETAKQVYQLQKEAQAQVQSVRESPALTEAERQLTMQAIQARTEQSISAALGPKAFKAYRKFNGDWLAQLADNVRSPVSEAER